MPDDEKQKQMEARLIGYLRNDGIQLFPYDAVPTHIKQAAQAHEWASFTVPYAPPAPDNIAYAYTVYLHNIPNSYPAIVEMTSLHQQVERIHDLFSKFAIPLDEWGWH